MTAENLCGPSPILAPFGEILCEPRRLWRHGSRAPGLDLNWPQKLATKATCFNRQSCSGSSEMIMA